MLIELLRQNPAYKGIESDEKIWTLHRENVLNGGYRLVDFSEAEDYDANENVVNLVATGTMVTEALKASKILEKQEEKIYANVIVITSADLVLGKLSDHNRAQLRRLIPKGERIFTPVVTVADASPSYLSGIGDTEGFMMSVENLGLKKKGVSTRSLESILQYHGISSRHMASWAKKLLNNRDLDEGGMISLLLDEFDTKNTGKNASSPVGGIDLNPRHYEIQSESLGINFEFTLDPFKYDLTPVNGFTPVIFRITPVTNVSPK